MSTAVPNVEAGHGRPAGAARRRLLALLLLTGAATLVLAVDWESPVRVAVMLGFLLLAPGLALMGLLRIRGPVQQLALAPPLSLALETLVAVALLYAGAYSTGLAFAIVAVVTVAALAVVWIRSP